MSLLKICQGRALRQVLEEIKPPVRMIYFTLEQPEPALTQHLFVTIQPVPSGAVADRLVVQSHSELIIP